MEWFELYPVGRQPTMEQIADYIGEAKELWLSLISYIESTYNIKPLLTYSGCGGKPGWNVKYQKSGKNFGTLYPEEGSFTVFLVISYKLSPLMDELLPLLSKKTVEEYQNAYDYMKMGKFMMFKIYSQDRLEDYKKILTMKIPQKKK